MTGVKNAAELEAAFQDYREDRLGTAEQRFRSILACTPRSTDALIGLGAVVAATGRVAESLEHFREACEIDPGSLDAARCVAQAALHLDRLDVAEQALRAALELAPGDASLHAMNAETLASTGRHRAALASAQEWARLSPEDPSAHKAIGEIARELGDYDQAIEAYRRTRAKKTSDTEALAGIARCLAHARFEGDDAQSGAELLEGLRATGVDTQSLARPSGDLLRARYELGAEHDERPRTDSLEERWVHDELLFALLEQAINVDPRLEKVLRAQRTALLGAFLDTGRLHKRWLRLATAMAAQAVANEHVWFSSDREREQVAKLRSALEDHDLHNGDLRVLSDLIIIVALYEPLLTLDCATALASTAADLEPIKLLITRALLEPLEERSLSQSIPRAQLEDPTSKTVGAMYEESPYPRWITLPPHQPESAPDQLQWAHPAFKRAPCFDAPPNVLIAGCGTGRHALRVARREHRGQVLAIDLSIASLSHAARKARELGIDNVRLRQLDLLEAKRLEQHFSIIESFGVLHHMQEPAAGLASLADRLLPGGVIKLGLYSKRARRNVTAARERIGELGIGQSPYAVRAFRARILDGSEPSLIELLAASDFYSTSACRDLLFHVHEVQYTPLELKTLIEGAGLRFLGFQLQTRETERRYRELYEQDRSMTDLGLWDRYEEAFPDTFPNTFEFWCQKPEV